MKDKSVVENIPKKKLKSVDELTTLIKSKKTILIASIKGLPASQFQEISKKLRGKAVVKVPKKNLILMAIDNSGKAKVVKDYINESVAILFSDLDGFDLALELIKNKSPAKAKAGQEAPIDIEVQEGPTDLVPGPAISELGAVGIQIKIEKGKIHIKEPKVIVGQGQKISQKAADIMGKLDIKPFSVGFVPLASFDNEEGKLYANLNIDLEGTLKELKTAFGKALAFAVKVSYVNSETIKLIIGKAGMYEKALSGLVKDSSEKKEEEPKVEENKTDENKEVKEETKDNTQSVKSEEENK